jgi:hypothetical protein
MMSATYKMHKMGWMLGKIVLDPGPEAPVGDDHQESWNDLLQLTLKLDIDRA